MMPSSQRYDWAREIFDDQDETNSPLTSRKPFHIHTWLSFSTIVKERVVSEVA
jgi:hypothetical protein